MTCIVFETPGLIDVRAFTIMGAHAKPNSSNPIGFFGTGLKYAIAVLVRMGCEPVIWIGRDRVSFAKHFSKFRGTDLETIKMRVLKDGQRRATYYELPYTTAYGKKWEPWQAFRELESNTRDEGGTTSEFPDWTDTPEEIFGRDDKTFVIVNLPEFVDAYRKRDEIFYPNASRAATGILEAFETEGSHLYYRSMKVLELGKPSIFTYNLLEHQDLTEDRTLKYEFYAKTAVAKWVVTQANANQIERVLKADKDAWEFGLEFPSSTWTPPSDAFKDVMLNRRKPASPAAEHSAPQPVISGTIHRNAHIYFAPVAKAIRQETPRTTTYEAPWRLTDAHPRPWRVEGLEVQDSQGNAVFAAPDGYYDEWPRTAEAIISRVNIGMK